MILAKGLWDSTNDASFCKATAHTRRNGAWLRIKQITWQVSWDYHPGRPDIIGLPVQSGICVISYIDDVWSIHDVIDWIRITPSQFCLQNAQDHLYIFFLSVLSWFSFCGGMPSKKMPAKWTHHLFYLSHAHFCHRQVYIHDLPY